jgi:hypothetical protein
LEKLDIKELSSNLVTLRSCIQFAKIAKFLLEFELDEIIGRNAKKADS